MQTLDSKLEELNKLNMKQRMVMKKLWNGRDLFKVYVELTPWNTAVVKVCNLENFWLVAELGPKGGIDSKRFQRL
jgi:hypothetical protein